MRHEIPQQILQNPFSRHSMSQLVRMSVKSVGRQSLRSERRQFRLQVQHGNIPRPTVLDDLLMSLAKRIIRPQVVQERKHHDAKVCPSACNMVVWMSASGAMLASSSPRGLKTGALAAAVLVFIVISWSAGFRLNFSS